MFNQHLYLIIRMSSRWPSNNFYYVDSPLVSNYIILISGFITDIQIYTNTILFQHCITVNRNYLIRIYPYDHPANFYYMDTPFMSCVNLNISMICWYPYNKKITTLHYSKRLQYNHPDDIQMTIQHFLLCGSTIWAICLCWYHDIAYQLQQ